MLVSLISALIGPKMTAAAAEVFPSALKVIVICNGVSMQTITVDANGDVVDLSETDPCTPQTLSAGTRGMAAWQRLHLTWQVRVPRGDVATPPAPRTFRPPGHGPPLARV